MEPRNSLPSSQEPILVHILSHKIQSYFFKIHFSIISPTIPTSCTLIRMFKRHFQDDVYWCVSL
jgi:hypothetical protein